MSAAQTPFRRPLEDPVDMQIAEPDLIRVHRATHRRSLRWVADKVGCSHNQISRYERGIQTEIPADWAITLAEVLDMPFARVFRSMPEIPMSKVSSGLDDMERVA